MTQPLPTRNDPTRPSTARPNASRAQEITVYGKPLCVQCDATKRALTQKGIRFREVDVTQDQQALQTIKDMGYQQAPVVVVAGRKPDSWSGFRPDKIKALDVGGAGGGRAPVSLSEPPGRRSIKF